jgi:hypothetical protein
VPAYDKYFFTLLIGNVRRSRECGVGVDGWGASREAAVSDGVRDTIPFGVLNTQGDGLLVVCMMQTRIRTMMIRMSRLEAMSYEL